MRAQEKIAFDEVIKEGKNSPDLSKFQRFMLTFKSIIELVIWILDKIQERKYR